MLNSKSEFELKNLKKFVEAHPLGWFDLQKIQEMGCVIGSDERFTATIIQADFRCHVVYSVEDHSQRVGKDVRFRHVSIYQDGMERPLDSVVNAILEILGFHVELDTPNKHLGIKGTFKVSCVDEVMDIAEIYDFGR